jgi:aspartate/methionine/tyrosine aminotransferase
MPDINPAVAAIEAPPIPMAHGWAARYDGAHGPLLDMCQAVPGYPPHPELLSRIAAAAAEPAQARYGLIPGDLPLRRAYAADVAAAYGGAVDETQVAITAGCNQAFVLAMMTLARHGENVILPTPWFWNHQQSCRMLGIEPRPLACRPEDGFVPDPAVAASLIDGATRAILLVTPNNPTGAVYPPEVIASFHALCTSRGISLILDETYRDFLPPGQDRAHALFADPDWPRHLLHLTSFSKSYCIPGHRVGALVADAAVIEQATKVLDCLHICPQRAAQAGLAWAIPALRDWRDGNRRLIHGRAAAMRAAFAALPAWRLDSLGAYFAYVRAPGGGMAAAERLATGFGVVGLPGQAFDPAHDTHLRLAFATVDEAGIGALARRLSLA